MADCENQVAEYPDKTKSSVSKISKPSFFSRSVTFNTSSSSTAAAAAAAEVINKPMYNLYNTPAFQRGGSIKSLYSSPFGSMVTAGNSLKGKVSKLCSIFESPKCPSKPPNLQPLPSSPIPTKLLLPPADFPNFIPKSLPSPVPDSPFRLPGTEDRVVIYFTSLRGIRKTFQDCHSIRMIFRGLRVNLDERDISMDTAYKKELQKVLGENSITLPQVFIKGKYIGGADVVKQLLEAGELVRMIKGMPLRPTKPCDACDDMRFIPCTNCNGSRKVFDEEDEQQKRCTECNETGSSDARFAAHDTLQCESIF